MTFSGVAYPRDAKPGATGAAGKTVGQTWPWDLAAGGRPGYVAVAIGIQNGNPG